MRIRTIKPEFFTHEALYEAEIQTKLPLRVAFIGLWCAADREGRFKWEPRRLGVAILPYDKGEFSRVLDALTTRGFIVKYESEGVIYGCVPSFTRHQVINNRESPSVLPEWDSRVKDACLTREVHAQGEGKGKEGEQEGKGNGRVAHAVAFEAMLPAALQTGEFRIAWAGYIAFRKRMKFGDLLAESVEKQFKRLELFGSHVAVKAIDASIANGWQGLFPEKVNGNSKPSTAIKENLTPYIISPDDE